MGGRVVDEFTAKVNKLLAEPGRIARLLALEKKRRGVPPDRLLILGISDIASYWWCAMKAVLNNPADEQKYFAAYLYDRLVYAHPLGLLNKLPRSHNGLLDAGKEISLDDVQKLLREAEQERRERTQRLKVSPGGWSFCESTDAEGRTTRLINPDLPAEEKSFLAEEAAQGGVRVIDLAEADPMLRGRLLQSSRAEKYPTIRWSFPWGPYVVAGVPDGITDAFVYEFKTTRAAFLIRFSAPVAKAQADLYGYFFRRPAKRVQIYVMEDRATSTWQEPIDRAHAERTLEGFRRVEEGHLPQPPRPWKCNRCAFRPACQICPLKPA
jgi:hypothetical protein